MEDDAILKQVMVTGGRGFIGTALVNLLIDEGHDVVIVDISSQDPAIPSVDILDESRIDILMEGCDAVVHLAAQISVQASIDDPSHTKLINVDGTEVLLRAAARHGVKRFIHASSAAVYGDEDGLPLDENQAGACLSPYAESKWQNERQLRDWRGKGLETIALRFFNVYGSGQSTGGGYAAVIPAFLHAMRSGAPVNIFGDGHQTRDFVHVSDVTRAILSTLTVDWGRLEEHEFNIASGRATSLLELHQSFVNAFHHHGVIVSEPTFKPAREGDIRHSVASIHRMLTILGTQPEISLEHGIKAMVDDALEAHD